MKNAGKEKCSLLKRIRKRIAEKYNLKYHPTECTHQGDCRGTCPACDAELRDLQEQLDARGIKEVELSNVQIEDTGDEGGRIQTIEEPHINVTPGVLLDTRDVGEEYIQTIELHSNKEECTPGFLEVLRGEPTLSWGELDEGELDEGLLELQGDISVPDDIEEWKRAPADGDVDKDDQGEHSDSGN